MFDPQNQDRYRYGYRYSNNSLIVSELVVDILRFFDEWMECPKNDWAKFGLSMRVHFWEIES